MKKKKLKEIGMWLIVIIVALAIGGSFVNGAYLNVLILSLLPLIVLDSWVCYNNFDCHWICN